MANQYKTSALGQRAPIFASMGMWRDSLRRIPPIVFFLWISEWLDHAEGHPHASWLRQVESYLKDTGMASAWAMARRRPKEYRRKVDAATRCSGVCPHTWPGTPQVGRYFSHYDSRFFHFLHVRDEIVTYLRRVVTYVPLENRPLSSGLINCHFELLKSFSSPRSLENHSTMIVKRSLTLTRFKRSHSNPQNRNRKRSSKTSLGPSKKIREKPPPNWCSWLATSRNYLIRWKHQLNAYRRNRKLSTSILINRRVWQRFNQSFHTPWS